MSDVYTLDPADDTVIGNVFDFLLGSAENDPSADRSRARVLEVAQVFGENVLDIKHFARGHAVQLGATLVKTLRGTRAGQDFFVPTALLPADVHPIFQPDGAGWVCVVDPRWTGTISGPEGSRTLAEAARPGPDGLLRIALEEDEQAVIDLGATSFVARWVHPSRRVPVQGAQVDYPLVGILGFISFVAMMFGVALTVVPSPPTVSGMGKEVEDILVTLQRPPAPPPAPAESASPKEAPKGPEGAAGPKSAEKPRPKMSPHERDVQIATSGGILGALDRDANLDSMLGDAGLPSAVANGVGGLIGPKASSIGGGGLAARSGGFGGGGTAESAGGFGPRARGYGKGCVGAECGGKPTAVLPDPDGGMIALGSLDRAQIDAVIKQNMAQIRYCYQRELNKNPGLGGKVTVKFVIAKDGSVSSATTKTTTLGNGAVENCINGRFMRFQFPQPKGGGIVIVSYPFLFSPS